MTEKSGVRRTGGDVLVDVMRRHGVTTAFGVISIHNLPLVEAVDRDLEFVEMRHEAAAVNAADAYARATGGIGVALTSTGTGAGNAAGSMIEALTAGSRVLHITGQIETEFLAPNRPAPSRGVIHEFPKQPQLLDAVSVHSATINDVKDVAVELETAIRRIRSAPTGPASIEWPSDLQYLATPEKQRPFEMTDVPVPVADADTIARGVELIDAAKAPLFWLGGGAAGAGPELTELAHRVGAGILTSNSGRGIVPETDPLVIGNFATTPQGRALLADSDLLIAVGTHFRSNETASYSLSLPDNIIQIDVEASTIGRVYPATVGIVGDARSVLTSLADRVAAQPGWTARVAEVREAVRSDLTEYIGGYADICAAMRTILPDRSPIARDVTIPSSQWGNRLLPIHERETNIFPLGGGIGQGLAMGIGAAHGRRDVPTLVMVGDGGLAVHLGELASLAGSSAHVIVVVFNDGGYGVLRNMQEANGFRRSGVDLHTPRFDLLAASLDIPHRLIQRVETFADALTDAIGRTGPSIIEVDVASVEPTPGPFVPPVHVPSEAQR
ncbi:MULTISPECIES: thiamine pyrophosphate-binding protein [Rhodococcus]|uniref:acetolactate synthase n=1 Tax=Rhodococcus cerastii TaxID=908616 RepID=A0ABU4D479_9NOCA|nr:MULTISPECIES: thiamine pyrophosphate-binding protein [Rhodococcus]MDV6304512.1 thiamine pyrophosphate-binding protein [Rhodococcus cerastii]MDV8057949.1 thiamine pyrophosphate-binding protein [Rhodococcus sp. IEGM 1343]